MELNAQRDFNLNKSKLGGGAQGRIATQNFVIIYGELYTIRQKITISQYELTIQGTHSVFVVVRKSACTHKIIQKSVHTLTFKKKVCTHKHTKKSAHKTPRDVCDRRRPPRKAIGFNVVVL